MIEGCSRGPVHANCFKLEVVCVMMMWVGCVMWRVGSCAELFPSVKNERPGND